MELIRFATDRIVGQYTDWKRLSAIFKDTRKMTFALICLLLSLAVGPSFRPPYIPLHMDLFVALKSTGKFSSIKDRIKLFSKAAPVVKKEKEEFKNYHFPGVSGSLLSRVDVYRIGELPETDVQGMILKGVPTPLNRRLKKFLPIALEMSERFQVDPFWVLSIMWTESHFNPKALSPLKARGLMQIMPRTGQYLLRKMGNRRISLNRSVRLTRRPRVNIKLGVYYLKRLLRMFKGNYIYATVAYNMGPGWVRQRLRRRKPVGTKNQYLQRVISAYSELVGPYKSWFSSTQAPFLTTFAAASAPRPELSWYDKKFELFPLGLPFDIAMVDLPKSPSIL